MQERVLAAPDERARGRRAATPVQRCVVDQPSTQAIGSVVGVLRHRTAARARLSRRPRRPRRRGQPPGRVAVSAGVMPAAAAVLLTWKSFGPVPNTRPRGASSASRRSGPPTVSPTLTSSSVSERAADQAEQPAAADRRRGRGYRREPVRLGRLGARVRAGRRAAASGPRARGRRGPRRAASRSRAARARRRTPRRRSSGRRTKPKCHG